jgi:flavorubredoxin
LHKAGIPFPMSLLNETAAVILGSPTEYGNVTTKMQTSLESMPELKAARKLSLKGKIGGVFGSYEWDGGWAVDMLAIRMKKFGIKLIPPFVSAVGESHDLGSHIDQKSLKKCREMGKAVAVRTH